MVFLARTHGFYLFKATEEDFRALYRDHRSFPVRYAFSSYFFQDPRPFGRVIGLILNESILQPVTIAAVKTIFQEIAAAGDEGEFNIIDLIDNDVTDSLERAYDAICNDPADPGLKIKAELFEWQRDNNKRARYWNARRAWESEIDYRIQQAKAGKTQSA